MATVSVSVKAKTERAKDNSRTLGYVNPEATNAQLKQMAIAYNALSTKTYQSGEKIVRTDFDESEPGAKTEPTLEIGNVEDSRSETTYKMYNLNYTYTGDGEIFYKTNYRDDQNNNIAISTGTTNKILIVKILSTTVSSEITIALTSTETDNYASKTVSKTITLA